jgi:hypothetical protein
MLDPDPNALQAAAGPSETPPRPRAPRALPPRVPLHRMPQFPSCAARRYLAAHMGGPRAESRGALVNAAGGAGPAGDFQVAHGGPQRRRAVVGATAQIGGCVENL